MKLKILSFILICAFALSACMQNPLPTTVPDAVALPTEVSLPVIPTETTLPVQIQGSSTDVPAPLPVQSTDAEGAAIQALSAKYGIPAENIKVINSEPMTWPSGCLGVVLPGVMCTSQVVDGFKITLEANGKEYEFHTNGDGSSALDAAQLLATIQFAVFGSNQTVSLVNPNIPLGPTYNPSFNGFLPAGGSVSGTAYVLDFASGPKALAIDGNGPRDLSFIQKPNYGLAIWRGAENKQPRLAWGTQLLDASNPSLLQTSNTDGSDLETLLTGDVEPNRPTQFVAEFWSVDGHSLYFSKEPVGIGGYISFSGASNLYRIDIDTKAVTELIPQGAPSDPIICLDAISADFRFVVDHCAQKLITIHDLNNANPASTIQPPAEVSGYNFVGSARFSPDGKRVAFALAKGDPTDEQSWLALSDGASGVSKLIYTGQAGSTFTIIGWLDDQTLLLETRDLKCDPTCNNGLWTIGVDGSNLTKVADGSFLAIIDNR